ncbi:MAG: 4Fe-4S dicluster domain-containing protein [Deltaproteobacteria bacterium]|nr:MAG: 4Fe-4S dicluster domain-containing protein [Deltaproteobacteria bacterium]
MVYLKDVVTLALDAEKCVGCGMCVIVCPHRVFSMPNGTACIENRDACMECGACAQNCPVEAVTVSSGVGCAAAIINGLLGRDASGCCCVIEPKGTADHRTPQTKGNKGAVCC